MASSSSSDVKIANLATVSLAKLKAEDQEEMQKLLEVSTAPGIFFLDLRSEDDDDSQSVLNTLPELYSVAKVYFAQPREVKVKDARRDQEPDQDRGYKQSECDETFEMSIDEFNTPPKPDYLPPLLSTKSPLLTVFSQKCHSALLTLLASLSSTLPFSSPSFPPPPPADLLTNFHSPTQPSDSGLKLIYEPTKPFLADVTDNLHTDSGTFTLLFYDALGLQVELISNSNPNTQSPDGGLESEVSASWEFTPLLPEGCALVNVANSLGRLSGGILHSPRHRVTQIGDGAQERYYISYFLRPERTLTEKWAAEVQEEGAKPRFGY